MYTQNTPVHVKLWHREFWNLAVANLLLTISVYMFIPVLPLWMKTCGASDMVVALSMLAFGLGTCMLGCFCSFMVQHYRRHHVCQFAMTCLLMSLGIMYVMAQHKQVDMWMVALRLAAGAAFGFAQMVLMSTLVIDTCESFQRTEANHSCAWFGRLSLSLGPLLALVAYRLWGFSMVVIVASVCCALAVLLVELVDFPFKAPDDKVSTCSLDRFFLSNGVWLFVNLLLVTIAVGLLLSVAHTIVFYGMMMAGFLGALVTQKFVFENADLKSEIVTGLFLLAVAILMMLSHQKVASDYIAPVLVGLGLGIVGARFLLFFIKLSKHCQRGTSQSTYVLACEVGLSIGLFIGLGYMSGARQNVLTTAIFFDLAALAMYHLFTHSWYLNHKNR